MKKNSPKQANPKGDGWVEARLLPAPCLWHGELWRAEILLLSMFQCLFCGTCWVILYCLSQFVWQVSASFPSACTPGVPAPPWGKRDQKPASPSAFPTSNLSLEHGDTHVVLCTSARRRRPFPRGWRDLGNAPCLRAQLQD